MNKQVIGEILSAFIHGGQRAEKMPKDDPLRVKGELAAAHFTEGVGLLKTVFPNPDIRDLMSMVWDLVGHRVVATAMGPEVPSLSLAVAGTISAPQALIFIPHNWVDMIHENSMYQLGALVFVGSQAVDYYNGRIVHESEIAKRRARAHEAEFLVTLKEANPDLTLNEWQQSELHDFPDGLRSACIKAHLYKRKAFVPPA